MCRRVAEGMTAAVFAEVLDVDLPSPFPRLTWREAMERYGSDKPDLRLPLELVDVDEHVADAGVQGVFRPGRRPAAARGGAARARRRRASAASRSTTTRPTLPAMAPRGWPGSRWMTGRRG